MKAKIKQEPWSSQLRNETRPVLDVLHEVVRAASQEYNVSYVMTVPAYCRGLL